MLKVIKTIEQSVCNVQGLSVTPLIRFFIVVCSWKKLLQRKSAEYTSARNLEIGHLIN